LFSQTAKSAARRVGAVIAVVLAVAYVVTTLRGPQGIPALIEKRREIRDLQEQNANLMQEIQMKRDRLKRLRESQAEQEMEIRNRLKLLRPGETSFILPNGGTPPAAPASPAK
jgi:cell division protein FtsB